MPTQHYVTALLERNIRVLIYVRKNDWICNHVGNEAWTLDLEWSGHDEFSTQRLREWKVDGKSAGKTCSAKGLTFVTIWYVIVFFFSFRFILFVDGLYHLFIYFVGAL